MSNQKTSSSINGVPSLEGRLILNVLRELNPEKEINRQVDWQYLFEITEYHRITSFIFFYLQQRISIDISKVLPEPMLQKFNIRLKSDMSQTKKVEELENLLLEMQTLSDIKIVFMEDFVLKHCVYPRPEFRETNYVDIWVNNKDMNKVFSFLTERGFSVSVKRKNTGSYYKISLSPAEQNKINVKLHYSLPFLSFYSFYSVIKPHINHTVDLNLNNSILSTVQSEYLLLHLIVKMYTYNKLEFTLRDLLDIKFLTQQGVGSNIDMIYFTRLVKQLGLQEPTYFWFKLISYIFQTHHLDYVLNEIAHSVRDTVKQEARHIGDSIDILMKPGQGYVSKLKEMLLDISTARRSSAMSKFFHLMKQILFISQEDFEKLYFERINNPIDSKIRYFSHSIKFLPYYYILLIRDS
jgi:hypothetical protein